MNKTYVSIVAVAVLMGVSGCKTVPVNKADATPPIIELKVQKNGEGEFEAYDELDFPASSSYGGQPTDSLKIACTAKDSDGIKSAALSVTKTVQACTSSGTVYYNVPFYVEGLPQDQSASIAPKADGTVQTQLLLLSDIQSNLSCKTGDPYKPIGAPSNNQTITVTCVGGNWSGNPAASSATKSLLIKF